ncbi:MAG: hypothetical protein ACD_45C00343G0002 [uncultured bacterium]|nr:MAG: hypothetical protein ACD_45C00343G0002 [uncultured bacterium]
MFRKKSVVAEPAYPGIEFVSTLYDPLVSTIKETDAEQLNSMIKEKLRQLGESKEVDNTALNEAFLCAQKMAIYHGVPGLIHYTNLTMLSIDRQLAEGEWNQTQGFNALIYLRLAERLHEQNPEPDNRLVQRLMPDERITATGYWDQKREALAWKVGLRPGEARLEDANSAGDGLFQDVISESPKQAI